MKCSASLFVLVVPFVLVAGFCDAGESRLWTSSAGSQIEAELISISGDLVRLRSDDGRLISLSLSQLSEVDRKFLEQARASSTTTEEGVIESREFQPESWYALHQREGYQFAFEYVLKSKSTVQIGVPTTIDGGKVGLAFAFAENEKVREFSKKNRGGVKITQSGNSQGEMTLSGGGGSAGGEGFDSVGGKVSIEVANLTPFPITGVIWVYPLQSP